MEWGILVLVIQFFLLVAGWVLFQHAKAELNAKAAEAPVLSEARALHKSVTALLEQLKLETVQTSAQLEARCLEARDLLDALERQLNEFDREPSARNYRITEMPPTAVVHQSVPQPPHTPEPTPQSSSPFPSRHQDIYRLADGGANASEIVQQTGFSEGEVELILSLRSKS